MPHRKRHAFTLGAAALAASAALVIGGCDLTTLDSLVTSLAADTTAVAGSTDQVAATTSATAASQTESATNGNAVAGSAGPAELSTEQQAALDTLQAQLDAGTITQAEFCTLFRAIVGNPPCGPPLPPITLTDEQRTQAETIFAAARDAVVALHASAQTQVLALLTAEQQAALEDLQLPPPPEDEFAPVFDDGDAAAFDLVPPAPPCPPAEDANCLRPAIVPLPPCPLAPEMDDAALDANDDFAAFADEPRGPGGPPPGGHHGGPPHGGPDGGPPPMCMNEDVIAALTLTADQVTAITAVHDALHAADQQVQEDALTAFRVLLTAEQIAELDSLPPPPPGGHGHGPGGPPPPPHN